MMRALDSRWVPGDNQPELTEDELHHLLGVRRLRVGEPFEILNGRGALARCKVEAVDRRRLTFSVEEVRAEVPPVPAIDLYLALPKSKTMAAVLAKAVELGVDRIIPLQCQHCEASAERAEAKAARWQAILNEALKQSGNPWLPQLASVQEFSPAAAAAAAAAAGSLLLCAALQPDAQPLLSTLRAHSPLPRRLALWVGPEGDFSQCEYHQLRQLGITFISLGPHVLRVETAVTVLLGCIRSAAWADF